jgi:uncharacterized protein YceH (UPF0502 family)
MIRPNSHAWMLVLLMWPLIGLVSLAGCKRPEIAEAEEAARYQRTHGQIDIDSRVALLEKRVAELEAKTTDKGEKSK